MEKVKKVLDAVQKHKGNHDIWKLAQDRLWASKLFKFSEGPKNIDEAFHSMQAILWQTIRHANGGISERTALKRSIIKMFVRQQSYSLYCHLDIWICQYICEEIEDYFLQEHINAELPEQDQTINDMPSHSDQELNESIKHFITYLRNEIEILSV